jgi:hypothetical protein
MGVHVQEGKCVWRAACCNLRQPLGLVECARFVSGHGSRGDVVQDSHCDPLLVVGGFAERASFVARPGEWARDKSPRFREAAQQRTAAVAALMQVDDAGELRRRADATGIRWFVLEPGDAVRWPAAILGRPVFTSHGYRVYDFTELSDQTISDTSPRH